MIVILAPALVGLVILLAALVPGFRESPDLRPLMRAEKERDRVREALRG